MKLRTKLLGVIGLAGFLAVAAHGQGFMFYSTLTGSEGIADQLNPTGASFTSGLLHATSQGVNAQTGTTYTILGTTGSPVASAAPTGDMGKLVTFNNTGAIAVTLPQAGTVGFEANKWFCAEDLGTGSATITPTTSTINGSATLVLGQGRGACIISDGTNYQTQLGGGGLAGAPLTVPEGGTGLATITAHGVMVGEGTAAVAPTAAGTTGQLLQATTSADPTWATTLSGAYTYTAGQTYAASAAALTPQKDQAGTLNTAAVAGGHEFDGTAFYDSAAASSRQVRDDEQFQILTSPFTLTSQTAAQQALNVTTNGALAVAGTTSYRFECTFGVTTMSASSGSFGFAFGLLNSATLTNQYWQATAQKGGTSLATAGAAYQTFNTAANTALVAASTGTTGSMQISGVIEVNHAGSVQPQISLGVAAAAVVVAGSGCRFWPLGTNTVTNVGNWN